MTKEREEKLRTYLTYEIESLMLQHPHDTTIGYTCKNCNWRGVFPVGKVDSVFTVVDYIIGLAKKSELFAQAIWHEIGRRLEEERKSND